jgi:hypothetical protein
LASGAGLSIAFRVRDCARGNVDPADGTSTDRGVVERSESIRGESIRGESIRGTSTRAGPESAGGIRERVRAAP